MTEALDKRAMLALFRGESENSFRAAGRRMAGGSSSKLKEMESRGVILLQGCKYDDGPENNPSIIRMNRHVVLPEVQSTAYNVPLLSPTTALGRSAPEAVHDMCHSKSAATTNAKSSRYFYFSPGNLKYFKYVREACYTCRKISQRHGRVVIAPLHNIGISDMIEGVNLIIDTLGPYHLKTRPFMPVTRETARTRRDTVKLYVLLSVCMYSHRISAAVLDSIITDLLVTGLRCIMMEHGWHTKKLDFDVGSFLVPAAAATAEAAIDLEEDEVEDLSKEDTA